MIVLPVAGLVAVALAVLWLVVDASTPRLEVIRTALTAGTGGVAGQRHPSQQRTIGNVICAYRRMPYATTPEVMGEPTPEARLIRSDLVNADLEGADLTGADLSSADLAGAELTDTRGLPPERRVAGKPGRG